MNDDMDAYLIAMDTSVAPGPSDPPPATPPIPTRSEQPRTANHRTRLELEEEEEETENSDAPPEKKVSRKGRPLLVKCFYLICESKCPAAMLSQPCVPFCCKGTAALVEVVWLIFKRQLVLIIMALNFPFHSSAPSSLGQCFHRPLRCQLSLLPVSKSWPVTARTTVRYSGNGLRETRLIRERVCFMA